MSVVPGASMGRQGLSLHLYRLAQLCPLDPERSGGFPGTGRCCREGGDGFGPVSCAWAVSLNAMVGQHFELDLPAEAPKGVVTFFRSLSEIR